MKKKKLIPAVAGVLAASTLLLTGCSTSKVTFGNYWNTNSQTQETIHETLEYDVTFQAEDSAFIDYDISYSDGNYVTTFKSELYNGKHSYVYTAELSIKVTYTLGSESVTKEDSVKSEVRFYAADNGLAPVYSKKTILSHSPMNTTEGKLDQAYERFYFNIETNYYDADVKETNDKGEEKTVIEAGTAICNVIENPGEEGEKKHDPKKFGYVEDDISFIDNEQLLAAIRAISSSDTSATVETYSPFVGTKQKIKFGLSTAEDAKPFKYLANGTEVTRDISYREVKITLNGKNPGATQIAWVATGDESSNVYRNIMLHLETPLAYGIGTLIYDLRSATYA